MTSFNVHDTSYPLHGNLGLLSLLLLLPYFHVISDSSDATSFIKSHAIIYYSKYWALMGFSIAGFARGVTCCHYTYWDADLLRQFLTNLRIVSLCITQ